jgi:hypothetical protein
VCLVILVQGSSATASAARCRSLTASDASYLELFKHHLL